MADYFDENKCSETIANKYFYGNAAAIQLKLFDFVIIGKIVYVVISSLRVQNLERRITSLSSLFSKLKDSSQLGTLGTFSYLLDLEDYPKSL